jgi:hypothetical protein
MRLAAILLGSLPGLLLAVSPATAKAPIPWPTGTYGNVRTHEETGDMLGMEARFFERGGRRMVEFVWCEGWCNDVHVMPVTRGDHGVMFHYSQRSGGDASSSAEMHFVAWPAGGRLKVSAWQGREKLGERPQQLRRLPRPYAIPFAKANGAR